MDDQKFAESSNGDRWFVRKDSFGGESMVLHVGNSPSGGHETRSTVEAFLAQKPFGPEHDALRAILAEEKQPNEIVVSDDGKTPSLEMAEEYMRLGGRRRVKVDDNIVSTRKWEDEPAEADAFWNANVASLDDKRRREIEIHLPSISDI
ncbi:glycosyltransferase [Pararhizobium arenae]|uniref:glycosyltransferase n=1 Tax=Pararhizobium arenae TaxID=1856850 RepID=UPI000A7FF53B|nr:glycosyltransferase [Pararhizobium arenae]